MKEEEFSKVAIDFIKWHLKNSLPKDISEEEFSKELEARIQDLTNRMRGVMYASNGMENSDDNFNNPFFYLFLAFLFQPSSNNPLKYMAERSAGRTLTDEEVAEFSHLTVDNAKLRNIIDFLKSDIPKSLETGLSEVDKSLIALKKRILPIFEDVEHGIQKELSEKYKFEIFK